MSQENLEVVRRSFEALPRGDFETAFADHDADVEWQTAADEPDRETYRGIEGLRRFVAAVAEPWEDRFGSTVELKDFIARGDWVLVPWRARLHGRGSGLEVEVFETYAVLVRGGKIVRVDEYRTGGTQVAFEALESMRRQLSSELGPKGVRVVTLRTGGIAESIPEGIDGREAIVDGIESETMLGRAATLEDVGYVAAFVASDRARTMTAATANISCGALVD